MKARISEEEFKKAKGECNLQMNLYDLNKQLIEQMPDLQNIEIIEKAIDDFAEATNNRFYMLYGREIHYFTLFEKPEGKKGLGKKTLECLKVIANNLKSIELTEAKDAFEIWIMGNSDVGATCLYLFPYDTGLVTLDE